MPIIGSQAHSHFIPVVVDRVSRSSVYIYNVNTRTSKTQTFRYKIIVRLALVLTYFYNISVVLGATRLYFHSTSNPIPNLPIVEQSSLTSNKGADAQSINRLMNSSIGTSQTSISLTSIGSTSLQRYYFTRFVSDTLSGITDITPQTWIYNFATVSNTASSNFPAPNVNTPVRITCYVWRPSTQTKVGDILDGTGGFGRLATSERSQVGTFNGSLVSGVQNGDVICFEVWFEITQSATPTATDSFYYDGTTVNSTHFVSVSNHASFIQTPQSLTFAPLLTRVSLSRTFRYNIFSKVSLLRIHRYRILSKLSVSRTYRYAVIARTSLSRIYQYAIKQRLVLTRNYRYAIIKRLLSLRLYKYNLYLKLSLSRSYRYVVIQRLLASRNYRYKIIGRISKLAIHRYRLLIKLAFSTINRYRLLNKVSILSIYKYNLFAKLSIPHVFKYNLLTSLSLSRVYNYRISARVSLSRNYIYGIISTLLHTTRNIVHLYDIKSRASLTNSFNYKILATISHSRIYPYNILQRVGLNAALAFDGVNDFVSCGNDNTLWSQSLTQFSFSIWVYAQVQGGTRMIVTHGLAGGQTFQFYQPATTTDRFNFRIIDAASGNHDNYVNLPSSILNTWVHLTCVYDSTLASNNVSVYANGIIGTGGSTRNLTQTINSSQLLTLAQSSADFMGYMKDFRWFTNKALTQTEINKIYANASDAPLPDYWLKMQELSGNPKDSISGTKTATLTNGTSWINNAPSVWSGFLNSYAYNILARMGITKMLQYRILNKILSSQIYKYGIIQRIGDLITHKYNILNKLETQRKYLYKIFSTALLQQRYRYSILQRFSIPQTYRYSIFIRILSPHIYKYFILNKIAKIHKYLYNIFGRLESTKTYKYVISTQQPASWSLTGKLTDFPDSIENLLKTHVNANWSIEMPPIGEDLEICHCVENFSYDHVRTYYIKIKEGASFVENRKVRRNTYAFSTPIEFECYSRRLKKGEAFQELDNMIWELVRIFGSYQKEQVYGIQGVTLDSITAIDNIESPGQVLWMRRLNISVYYYKVSLDWTVS